MSVTRNIDSKEPCIQITVIKYKASRHQDSPSRRLVLPHGCRDTLAEFEISREQPTRTLDVDLVRVIYMLPAGMTKLMKPHIQAGNWTTEALLWSEWP